MAIFFSADYHFGDSRLHLFPRPFLTMEECEQAIIENHNSVVKPNDDIFVLGDVALTEEKLELLGKMNGDKHLIKGNYDTFSNELYLKYFKCITNEDTGIPAEFDLSSRKYNLVHYPSKGMSDRFNLVGHIHGAWRVQKNMLNVGVDVWNYRPVSLNQVEFMFTAIEKFYDDDVWVAYNSANTLHMDRGRDGSAAKGTAK